MGGGRIKRAMGLGILVAETERGFFGTGDKIWVEGGRQPRLNR